jgi:hypothetical protein
LPPNPRNAGISFGRVKSCGIVLWDAANVEIRAGGCRFHDCPSTLYKDPRTTDHIVRALQTESKQVICTGQMPRQTRCVPTPVSTRQPPKRTACFHSEMYCLARHRLTRGSSAGRAGRLSGSVPYPNVVGRPKLSPKARRSQRRIGNDETIHRQQALCKFTWAEDSSCTITIFDLTTSISV